MYGDAFQINGEKTRSLKYYYLIRTNAIYRIKYMKHYCHLLYFVRKNQCREKNLGTYIYRIPTKDLQGPARPGPALEKPSPY